MIWLMALVLAQPVISGNQMGLIVRLPAPSWATVQVWGIEDGAVDCDPPYERPEWWLVTPQPWVFSSSSVLTVNDACTITLLLEEPRGICFQTVQYGGNADYNCDGDTGTDQDIEAFFACMAGNCCEHCGDDFDGDGVPWTDQDIEIFFLVLSGGQRAFNHRNVSAGAKEPRDARTPEKQQG